MKSLIRSATPAALRRFAGKAGRFLARGLDPEFPSIEASLGVLRGLGFRPATAVDIGAYHGEWAIAFNEIFPSASVLMIEGQESKRARLETLSMRHPRKLDFEIALLGAADDMKVTFCEMETGSSVFEEGSGCKREFVRRKLASLDTLLERHPPFRAPDMLKLDTQGYELEILKGASRVLETVPVVLMESSLVPVNKGAPLISEVISFMSERRFRLFDFCSQIRRTDGVLWQTDLLFLSERSPLIPRPAI
jgi:FkbM family methyltransferase